MEEADSVAWEAREPSVSIGVDDISF